jgi:hypothetical protein
LKRGGSIVDFSVFGADAIMKKVSDKALERRLGVAREKVESLRCQEHGKAATVSMEGTGKLVLTACCDAFRKQAMAQLRQR